MNTAIKITTPCICFVLLGQSNKISSAQDQQAAAYGTYIKQAADRLAKLVDDGRKQKFTLQENSFSTGGALLKKNRDRWVPIYTVALTEGQIGRAHV